MKNFIFILSITLAASCQKAPSDATSSDTTKLSPGNDTTVATVPYKGGDPYFLEQKGDTIELFIQNEKFISFKVPDSAKVEVTTGNYGTVLAHWEPYGLVTYKSLVVQFNTGYCYFPGDEGTSTEIIDTLAHGPGFVHGQFDNLVAGAYGIQEIYYLVQEDYCIRFDYTLGMSNDATPEDRMNEIRKLEAYIKTVSFE